MLNYKEIGGLSAEVQQNDGGPAGYLQGGSADIGDHPAALVAVLRYLRRQDAA